MKKIKLIFLTIIVLGVLWGFWLEPSYFRIANYPLSIPQVKGFLENYKIAVIADLHIGSPFNSLDKLKKIVQETNAKHPDLILIVGDLVSHGVVGGQLVEPIKIVQELKNLSAKDGVFAVLGNHDWWYNASKVRSALKSVGIPSLDETVKLIGSNPHSFWLMGIGDFWEDHPNIQKNLKSVTDDRPVIAFTHNPDVFPLIPKRVILTFAGHTHGGQVYIPFIGRPIVPSKYGQKYAVGFHLEGDHHLFVSPGIGTSILPVRFLVPPEVSIITINPY